MTVRQNTLILPYNSMVLFVTFYASYYLLHVFDKIGHVGESVAVEC